MAVSMDGSVRSQADQQSLSGRFDRRYGFNCRSLLDGIMTAIRIKTDAVNPRRRMVALQIPPIYLQFD